MSKASWTLAACLLGLAAAACALPSSPRLARRLAAVDIRCASALATVLGQCGKAQPADQLCCLAFKGLQDCLPQLTADFAAAGGDAATTKTAEQFNAIAAACGGGSEQSPAGGSSPGPALASPDPSLSGGDIRPEEEDASPSPAPLSPAPGTPATGDLGQGIDNFTTSPLPEGEVRLGLRYSPPVKCAKYLPQQRTFENDYSTRYGATGSAMPPASAIKALADVMCAKSAEEAAGQFLKEVAAGGEQGRVAVAAFFSKDYPCRANKDSTNTSVAYSAFLRLPEMDDPKQVMRHTVNVVQSADQIGFPLCITVAVAEPSPSTKVLFEEQVHTGRSLGVWPSPSGKTLPAGAVAYSRQTDMERVHCRTYNGTSWEDDTKAGPYGGAGTTDPPEAEMQAFINAMCTQPVDQVAQDFAEMLAAGGAEAQAALGACHLSDRRCANGTQVSCTPLWSAFWRVPEVISPATIMRYIPNLVAAYDSIGMGACVTVVVKEPKPSTVVLFQEQLHTNRVDSGAPPGAA